MTRKAKGHTAASTSWQASSRCVCIAPAQYFHIAILPTAHSPPGVISGPVTQRSKLFVTGKAEIWGSGDDASEFSPGICRWDRRQERQARFFFCAKILIGKRRKDLLYTLSPLRSKPVPRQSFPREGWVGTGANWHGKQFTVQSPLLNLQTRKNARAMLGMCRPLPQTALSTQGAIQQHKGPFSPDNHMPFHKQGHRLGVVTFRKGQDDLKSGTALEQGKWRMSGWAIHLCASLHCPPKPWSLLS